MQSCNDNMFIHCGAIGHLLNGYKPEQLQQNIIHDPCTAKKLMKLAAEHAGNELKRLQDNE